MENNTYYLEEVIVEFRKEISNIFRDTNKKNKANLYYASLSKLYDKINNSDVRYLTEHELLYLKLRYLLECVFYYRQCPKSLKKTFASHTLGIRLSLTMSKYLKVSKKK